MSLHSMQDPQALRRQLKQLRSSLSARARSDAEALVIHQLLHQPRFLRARRVAGYFGRNGEIDPMPLLARAAAMHKHCYLPVLHPFRAGSLWFCRWHPGERLQLNRYGIPEPVPSAGATSDAAPGLARRRRRSRAARRGTHGGRRNGAACSRACQTRGEGATARGASRSSSAEKVTSMAPSASARPRSLARAPR